MCALRVGHPDGFRAPLSRGQSLFETLAKLVSAVCVVPERWVASNLQAQYHFGHLLPQFYHGAAPMSDVTRILSAIEQGDPSAAEQLLPLVYNELRKLAAAKMAEERPGHRQGARRRSNRVGPAQFCDGTGPRDSDHRLLRSKQTHRPGASGAVCHRLVPPVSWGRVGL